MKANKTMQWALRPLLVATALLSCSALQAAETQPLNQPIAKGAYELAFSNSDYALFLTPNPDPAVFAPRPQLRAQDPKNASPHRRCR